MKEGKEGSKGKERKEGGKAKGWKERRAERTVKVS
jgi:hypothetical protein